MADPEQLRGFAGHGNFGPCIVWNDAVTNFAAPSYYMQKMLFTDNAGTRILPFRSSGRCYWSASIDTEGDKNDVLLKVANKSGDSERVTVILSGADSVDPVGHAAVLSAEPNAENSLTHPDRVAPSSGTFAAGATFEYVFPAYSVTALRVGIAR